MSEQKVTLDLLKGRVEYLNSITNNSETDYNNQKYELDSAYGGWALVITDDKHCIVKSITMRYSKKELYNILNAYIEGMWDSDRFST
tara:strand:+ start:474 stop:734 length:261 start_codon:yes stop_codon:yes gene_type:complete